MQELNLTDSGSILLPCVVEFNVPEAKTQSGSLYSLILTELFIMVVTRTMLRARIWDRTQGLSLVARIWTEGKKIAPSM